VGAKEQSGRTWSSSLWTRGTTYNSDEDYYFGHSKEKAKVSKINTSSFSSIYF
jgi:hypothetical protein